MPNIDKAIEDKIQLEHMEGAHGIPEYNKKTIEEAEARNWSERKGEVFGEKDREVVSASKQEVVKGVEESTTSRIIQAPSLIDEHGIIRRSDNILEWNSDEEKKEKLALIKKTVAKGVTDLEFALFIYQAKRTGLDPLSRQIYIIKRKQYNKETQRKEDVATIQTGIDGYRSVAGRTGQLAGISDVTFDSEEGANPKKATVTVYRLMPDGSKAEFTATARWEEYVPMYNDKPSGQWMKMPYLMLGKCAEALALRKAFPQDLSGIYTKEEMDQANKEEGK